MSKGSFVGAVAIAGVMVGGAASLLPIPAPAAGPTATTLTYGTAKTKAFTFTTKR